MTQSKREATRQRLADAALALFLESGFDNVTVDQIAKAAGVSRRTFFRHFNSKEKVVFPFTDARIQAYRDLVRAQTNGQAATFSNLKVVFSQIVQSWLDNEDRMMRSRKIVAQSSILMAYDHDVTAKWEHAIALELDGPPTNHPGEIGMPSLRARMVAGMLVGVMRPVFIHWYDTEGKSDLVGQGEEALDLVERGLGSLEEFLTG